MSHKKGLHVVESKFKRMNCTLSSGKMMETNLEGFFRLKRLGDAGRMMHLGLRNHWRGGFNGCHTFSLSYIPKMTLILPQASFLHMAVKAGLQYSQVLHPIPLVPGKRLTSILWNTSLQKKVLKKEETYWHSVWQLSTLI